MSFPQPSDLFMNIWVNRVNSEGYPKPGDDEWGRRRKELHLEYSRVWADCVELSKHLQAQDELMVSLMNEINPVDVSFLQNEGVPLDDEVIE